MYEFEPMEMDEQFTVMEGKEVIYEQPKAEDGKICAETS